MKRFTKILFIASTALFYGCGSLKSGFPSSAPRNNEDDASIATGDRSDTLDHCNEVIDSYVIRFLNSVREEEDHYKGFWYCTNCGRGNSGLAEYCSKCGRPRGS